MSRAESSGNAQRRIAPRTLLNPDERKALRRCERIVIRGAATFVRVGLALAEIRDRQLYRGTHGSFQAYCLDRFGFARAHGYRLIEAADTVIELTKVSPIGDTLNESQARELARVPKEMRPGVLSLATELAVGNSLTARTIQEAAIQLGAVNGGGTLMPGGGNDDVHTPPWLAKAIVQHFMPCGKMLEPCRGDGAFVRAMPGCDWFDITQERDFLEARGHWDWIVTNPPFSQFRVFLKKSMELADNIVFVSLVNAWWVRSRQADIREANFALVELCTLPIPKSWPQFGLTLAAGWLRRGWQGGIANTILEIEAPKRAPT